MFIYLIIYIKSDILNCQEYSQSITYDFEKSEKIKIDSITNTFKNQQKKIWLNLLPNFNYDFQNSSFNIGISLNSFASFYQQKQRNKIELLKLQTSLESKFESKIDKLELEIDKYYSQFEGLQNKIEIFQIDHDLFHISKGKYQNSEIPTEKFYELKRAYLINKNTLKSEFFKLKYIAKKIQQKSKNTTLLDSIIVLKKQFSKYNDP